MPLCEVCLQIGVRRLTYATRWRHRALGSNECRCVELCDGCLRVYRSAYVAQCSACLEALE